MKKLVIAAAFLLVTVNAHALLDIDWTGNMVAQPNDYPTLASNEFEELGLGGPVGNQAIALKAYEFTIAQNAKVQSLSLDATVVPWDDDPSQTGPQEFDVTFKLFKGTRLFGPDQNPAPDRLVFTSDTYTFSSIDASNSGIYPAFEILFDVKMQKTDTYWLWAENTGRGVPASFYYSTDFVGRMVNPEPATILLFGSGLAGAFMKRRKRA